MTKRNIFLVILLVLVLLIPYGIFSYFSSTQSVQIEYKNTSTVEIKQLQKTGEDKIIKDIKSSGQSVRLKKNQDYFVSYKGSSGFADGKVEFKVTPDKTKVSINPYYSESKLKDLLANEQSQIQQALKEKYPGTIGQYQIQAGKLYRWGEWYGTTLKYTGPDQLNADTLRVVLKKENNTWKIATDPPDITLSKNVYPSVPEDILRDINK